MSRGICRIGGGGLLALFVAGCSLIVDVGEMSRDDAGNTDTDGDLPPRDAADGDADVDGDADADADGDVAADEGSDGVADNGELDATDVADADADGDAVPDGDGDGDADETSDWEGGGDGDADADADAETDLDGGEVGDVDVDSDTDGEADGDDGSSICAGGWFDPSSGLCWQDPPDSSVRTWNETMAYCAELSLGGYGPGSWRMPTISELRSLIRGCSGTVTGGTCGVVDSCLSASCWSASCSCSVPDGGPGPGGCYWDVALAGPPGAGWCGYSWSSSPYDGGTVYVWASQFGYGSVESLWKESSAFVRCVRGA